MLRERGVGLGRDHAHRNPEMLKAVPQVVMEQAGQMLLRRERITSSNARSSIDRWIVSNASGPRSR